MNVLNRSLFQIVFAAACTAVLASAAALQNLPPETVILTVNGKAITEGDLEFVYLARGVQDDRKPTVRERYIEDLIDRRLLKAFLAEQKDQSERRDCRRTASSEWKSSSREKVWISQRRWSRLAIRERPFG